MDPEALQRLLMGAQMGAGMGAAGQAAQQVPQMPPNMGQLSQPELDMQRSPQDQAAIDAYLRAIQQAMPPLPPQQQYEPFPAQEPTRRGFGPVRRPAPYVQPRGGFTGY